MDRRSKAHLPRDREHYKLSRLPLHQEPIPTFVGLLPSRIKVILTNPEANGRVINISVVKINLWTLKHKLERAHLP